MTPFTHHLAQYQTTYPLPEILKLLDKVSSEEVERELRQPVAGYNHTRLLIFLSAAAREQIEAMAQLAHQITLQRFGKTIQLYAPLYVSNFCINKCLYCGYNHKNKQSRLRLSIKQAVSEAKVLARQGFRDLLLVSGEDREHITLEYLCNLLEELQQYFASICLETYQFDKAGYDKLLASGADGVTLYQETYNPERYAIFHPGGPKADFNLRLQQQEAAAQAGMRRLGIGALLGLSDWRFEAMAMGLHTKYLMQHYWQSRISFSFPRIQQISFKMPENLIPINDIDLTQMILALRLCFPDAGLTLSTRENESLRNHLLPLGITQISAGSRTIPGGYTRKQDELEQFKVSDKRSASEVAASLSQLGFDPVWKDWDNTLLQKQ